MSRFSSKPSFGFPQFKITDLKLLSSLRVLVVAGFILFSLFWYNVICRRTNKLAGLECCYMADLHHSSLGVSGERNQLALLVRDCQFTSDRHLFDPSFPSSQSSDCPILHTRIRKWKTVTRYSCGGLNPSYEYCQSHNTCILPNSFVLRVERL